MAICVKLADTQQSMFPFQVFYSLFESGVLEPHFQIPRENSWLLAAYEKQIPVYSPGFEDSTLGNIFAARVMEKKIGSHSAIKSGTAQMEHLVNWYLRHRCERANWFFSKLAEGSRVISRFAPCRRLFRISRKISGYGSTSHKFPIPRLPMGPIRALCRMKKITWCKLSEDTPKFMINSDASIVAPADLCLRDG